MSQVIVETNGLYAGEEYRTFLGGLEKHLVKTIINLNGIDTETYRALHGFDAYDRVADNARSLKDLNGEGISSTFSS